MMDQRFYVAEYTGYRALKRYRQNPGPNSKPGVTVTVYDRAYLHLPIQSWRSEDYRGISRERALGIMRDAANTLCDKLNLEHDG